MPHKPQCVLTADSVMFQGVDYSFLRNNFEELNLTKEKMRNDIINFFVNAVVKKQTIFQLK